ncbi:RNA polymerase II, Rpb [Trema orientale]|uniref:RNA polymerase II, Rpb n=1 Tax=Trema orientale TaxID=63057 RepID=A0A2P5EXR4_TREOI|nr:RNA polymerase II, Rpb [Trema orientale]
MSEKGGKGFSLPQKKGRKPSLKSTNGKEAPLKGKDDTPAKLKKGRKVQFDAGIAEDKSNFSSKYGGKNDTPTTFPKASSGLSGKGDKTFSSGKSSTPKPPPPLELKIEQELPKDAKCLMDCEAADILQSIQERMVLLSKDPTVKIPASFDRGLQYAKRGSHYTNPRSMCVIANVCPETADEVFALVPSLKAKKSMVSEPLKDALLELAKLKQTTSTVDL